MKKKTLFLLACLVVLLVLFVPIPTGLYKDGGTREYTALTYKLVIWNCFFEDSVEVEGTSGGIYHNTSIFWYPDNHKSITELWEIEQSRQSRN